MMTVVIGIGACLLAQGFMSHTLRGLRESLIQGGIGHFQIFRKGYLENSHIEPYRYLITDSEAVFRELRSLQGIRLFAPRLSFQGIASSGEKSTIVLGTAGIPDKERILNNFSTLLKGSFLNEKKPLDVMIGGGVARKLNAAVGDTLTVMTALKSGGLNALDLNVGGIIGAQIKQYDDMLMLADLKPVQKLLNLPNSADRIIVLLSNTGDLLKIGSAIGKICNKMKLEYRDWKQLAGIQYSQPKLFYNLVFMLMMMIIVFVVIFSITNTLNLAMQERIREIGTIRSLGTTRMQVVKIFISESFLIGFAGGLFGIIMGYGIAALFNVLGGIPIPPPPGQARGYIALFKPDILQAFGFWLIFTITATVAGFYPAFRASRLKIVDALRWL